MKKRAFTADQTHKERIRQYSDSDLDWIGLICCLKNTGMSIRQIRDFVTLSQQGPETLRTRCEMLQKHKCDVQRNIEEMNRHLEKVTHKIEYFTRQYEAYAESEQETQKPADALVK
jgi:DNA-binding transcriptional MerR regulator